MKHPVTGKEIVAERWQGDIDRAQARTTEPAV
jgi:carotenoid cleavage dioxygenase